MGPSGSGKSDLALRLIESGWQLVADDQTQLSLDDRGSVMASPASGLEGLIEVRGLGLVKVPHEEKAPLLLVVELIPAAQSVERLPAMQQAFLLDQPIKKLKLHAFEASTPIKIRLALKGSLVNVD